MNDETYIIAKGSHGALKSTQKLLTSNGIGAEIVQPPGEDLNKWGSKLWLAVASHQAKEAAEVMVAAERAGMTQVELDAADCVIDLDADQASCPACMGTIPKGSVMCPECGLRIG